ncbi:MAG: hypothetical protein ACI8ZB_001815 [Desulforhopalus sp.]|jgi:hypothetical protein
MKDKKISDEWVYVFVCDPGPGESYFGLYDEEKDLNFIPAFRTREEANDCFLELPRKKGVKHECQAVHVEEISEAAEKNGFVVTLVDSDGKVITE